MTRLQILLLAAVPLGLMAQAPPAPRAPQGRRTGSQQSGTAAPQPDAKPGAVRGMVTGLSGEPLRKAEVSLRPAGGRGGPMPIDGRGGSVQSRTTDASGTFSFDSVPPGNYTLSAQRAGYVRTDYGTKAGSGRRTPQQVAVVSGKDTSGLRIEMTPQAVVAGRVVDEDGDPIMHASVQVMRERWTNGKRQVQPVQGNSTDDRGEFRIAGLMPGRYFAMVGSGRPMMSPTPRSDGSTGDQTYTTTYYPGVNDLTQAAPIQLAAGQEMRGVDFRMRKVTTWRIRGRVLDEAGKPAGNLGVSAMPVDNPYAGTRGIGAARGNDGSFEIAGLQPGQYTLSVNRGGRGESRMAGRATVQVGNRDLDGVVIQLQPTLEVSGVTRVDGEGVQLQQSTVSIEVMDSVFSGAMPGIQKPDGTWTAGGLAPGKYRFYPSTLPEGTYLKAVMAGGQDITAGAQVSASATGLEIVLGTKAPGVSGTVLNADKQPVANATVVLIPEASKRDRYWLFRTTSTDESGAFRLAGLTPGQYSAVAVGDVEDGAWFSPEFQQRMEGAGTAVKLAEGSAETIQIVAAP